MTVGVVVDHFNLFFFHFLVQEANIFNTSLPMPTLPNDHYHYAPIFQSAHFIFTPPSLPFADADAAADSILTPPLPLADANADADANSIFTPFFPLPMPMPMPLSTPLS